MSVQTGSEAYIQLAQWSAVVKHMDETKSMHMLEQWVCRCLFRTLNLFVLQPTFIQTLLFDNEVCPATADWR